MIRKIIDIDKLKKYPANLYAVLWVVMCFAVISVYLSSAILIARVTGDDIHAAGCSIASVSVFSGSSISVKHNGFAAGESIRLTNVSTSMQQELGKTNASTTSVVTQNVVVSPNTPAGKYNISIVTRFPVVNFNCAGGPITIKQPIIPTACTADVNKDGKVNSIDQLLIAKNFGLVTGTSIYDLNGDGVVNQADIDVAAKFFNQKCASTFQKLVTTTSQTPTSITIKWSTPLPTVTYPQLLQLYYGDMTAAKTTTCSNTNPALTGSFAGAVTNTDQTPNYLSAGATSYTWTYGVNSKTSNYRLAPGHTYCLFFTYYPDRTSTPQIVSPFMVVTTDLYGLTSSASNSSSITLNWTPGLELVSTSVTPWVYTGIQYGDMTAANTTICSIDNPALTGGYGGTLVDSKGGAPVSLEQSQTTYTWKSGTSNYTPIVGHEYCFYIFQSNPFTSAGEVVSKFLQVKMPPVTPTTP